MFSCTSLTLWYKLAKSITDRLRGRLDRETGKVPTIGTKGSGEGSFSAAITRMLEVMRELNRSDIGSVSMWMFSNIGMDPDVDKQRIPNAALEFVYEVARHIPDREVNRLIDKDTKNYQTSLLNCVINRTDYLSLYPSKKYSNDGASHKLFMLYQKIVMGQSDSSLRTAYKIARYVGAGLGDDDDARDRRGIDLDKIWEKQVKVRQLMVRMVADGLLSFDEYYELFVVGSGKGHPWRLVKYYLLSEIPSVDFPISSDTVGGDQQHPYKARLIEVGKAIRDSYIASKSVARFEREVLQGLGRGQLGKRWLWDQLQILEEESANDDSSFDAQQTWRAFAPDDNLYELLFLLRLLWTGWQHAHI